MNQESERITEFLQTAGAQALMAALAGGRTYGYPELAELMHCPPDRVGKALSLLRSAGLELTDDEGDGVRLQDEIELLDEEAVLRACGPVAMQLGSLRLALGLSSTNDTLLEQARDGAASGTVCLAEWQGQGRGRQNRKWASPIASSIYLSVLWRFRSGSLGTNLGLKTGAVLANCLFGQGLCDLSLKWPNDLLWRGGKLGGILIEGGLSSPDCHYVVIGVGLNYRLPERVRVTIEQPVATLRQAMSSGCPTRNEWAGLLLRELVSMLLSVERGEQVAWQEDWQRYDCTCGRALRVLLPGGKEIHGVGAGLRSDGALLVRDGDRVHSILAGDVRVRVGQ